MMHQDNETMDWSSLLPPEILGQIFELLRHRDRKSVRLTSKWWYYIACNQPGITKREKLVILAREGHREAQISDTLLNFTYLRSEVELYGVHLPLLSSTVWTRRGHQMKSLLMRGCTIDTKTFSKIIFHCPNLTKLYVHMLSNDRRTVSDKKNSLDRLIKQKFKQKKLTSFDCYDCKIPDEVLDKIFQICPKIRRLGEDYPRTSMKRLSRIESYTHTRVDAPSGTDARCTWMLSLRSRLKELRVPLNLDEPENYNIIRQFFSRAMELEKLHLTVFTSIQHASNTVKELLFLILENSPKLKQMVWILGMNIELVLGSQEFRRFLYGLRHLESLHFGAYINEFHLRPLMPFDGPILLAKLKELNLGLLSQTNDEELYLRILHQCRDLECLGLELVTDNILETIIKCHTTLKRLHLNFHRGECSFAGFTGYFNRNSDTVYTFSQLKALEHLKVIELTPHSGALDGFLSDFDFPNLKCFTFSWQKYNAGKQSTHCILRLLTNIFLKAPQLEVLQIENYHLKTTITADELINHHITKLSKLGLLEITTIHEPREQLEELGKLFNVCPSLEHVTNVKFGLRLSYDHISKQSRQFRNTRFISPMCCRHSVNHVL